MIFSRFDLGNALVTSNDGIGARRINNLRSFQPIEVDSIGGIELLLLYRHRLLRCCSVRCSTATDRKSTCDFCLSLYLSICTALVVGVTPSRQTRSPAMALMNVDLPALNSPTMVTQKRSSKCSFAASTVDFSLSLSLSTDSTLPTRLNKTRSRSSI